MIVYFSQILQSIHPTGVYRLFINLIPERGRLLRPTPRNRNRRGLVAEPYGISKPLPFCKGHTESPAECIPGGSRINRRHLNRRNLNAITVLTQ